MGESAQPTGAREYGTIPCLAEPWVRPGLALILDMDGVVVDSNPLHRQAWTEYNRRHGIPTDEAMHQRMYGKRNDEIVRDFFGPALSEAEVAAHGAAKEALYRELMAGSLEQHLVPGVRGFLARHAGCPMGLGSNAEPANVAFVLDRAGLRGYFAVVVDGHQVRHAKPAPDVYLRVAEGLGVMPRNCIVFEDSDSGVAAALAAGMRTVGLRTTHRELPGVELAVDHFADPQLEPWLRSQIWRA